MHDNTVTAISLHNKTIREKIPATICDLKPHPDIDRLSRLRYLDLTANNFSGDIPAAIGRLRELFYLFLVQNEFNGTWPTEIGNLANLEHWPWPIMTNSGLHPSKRVWRIEEAEISVDDAGEFDWRNTGELQHLSSLEHLDLSLNKLEGTIPGVMLTLKNLTNLYLFNNRLSGRIPSSIEALNLKEIDLSKNHLTGSIPAGFGKLQNLTGLNLFWNQLSGKIPVNISLIPTLETFKVFSNQLSGVLPPAFGLHSELKRFERGSAQVPRNCTSLLTIQLSNNRFSGEIPSGIWTSPDMIWVMLAGNSFSGTLPTVLNASNNMLSGKIPVELTSLRNISVLLLDGNQFSENQFSGQIPPELGHLTLNILDLSFNQLSGMVPIEFQYGGYEHSFLNDPKLCVNVGTLKLPRCDAKAVDSDKLSTKYLVMILIFVVSGFLAVVLFTLLMVRDDNRKNHSRDHTPWKICNNRRLDHKLQKQFIAEVEILGTIRHSNIVKLLCCISNESSSLLVYEYMEKQSLDRWLHGKKQRTTSMTSSVHNFVLDWPTRLQIAIGAAKGLCHMHENCSAPIIHRDVKSSNILLDAEFNAKIADFGLAKMLVKQGSPTPCQELQALTDILPLIDVYSFGVVLLELVRGETQQRDELMCLVEWAWDQFREGKTIEEVMDEDIKEQCERAQCSPQEGHGRKKKDHEVAPLLQNALTPATYKHNEKGSDNEDDDKLV
ncbi:Receptor protein kinase CLAVATA1 [Vitis vinifera]|uniref:Receptor protein kinase CLAVATA1 n=1 Tax=Vitis vinifera TaxID=29760 RepID=A0A438H450_VITVI|nr:Receptor protein kinase CLAVATA1 [Vitis vinifera]